MSVTSLEIRSREPLDGGAPFGAAGAYERIDGVLHFAVDPAHPANERIVDLDRAARDPEGRVRFEADFTLLQPVDASKANGRLLADVPNRGGRTFVSYNLAARDARHPNDIPSGDGFLMKQGWTIGSIGWQWDVVRSSGLMGLEAPVALEDGRPMQGWVSVTQQRNAAAPDVLLSDRGHRPYTAADLDQPDARLLVRDYADAERHEIDRAAWRFARVEDGRMVPDATHVALDGGFEPGRFYEIIFRTDMSPIVGAGMLAFRDAASFLRYSTADDNPARGRLAHAFAFGISQSGRFLRTFMQDDMNADEEGRVVYDGFHVHIGGGRQGEFNHRRGQPSVTAPYGVGYRPPFTYGDTVDPRTEQPIPGLLTRLRARGAAPKVIATNTGTEYWRGDAALLHVDPAGTRDLPDQPETRAYFIAGAQHGGGSLPLADRSPIDPAARGAHRFNITHYGPIFRAALVNLERWVCDGVEPPPSLVPHVADGTAVPRGRVLATFRTLPTATVPDVTHLTTMPRLDFGPEADRVATTFPPGADAPFPTLVTAVDADGNEVTGIRLPDVAVPLATLMGWNPRHPDTGGVGQIMPLTGSTVPFPVSAAERASTGDPRLAIEERYRDRDDYLARVRVAAADLAAKRYILDADVEVCVANCAARWDALVPVAAR